MTLAHQRGTTCKICGEPRDETCEMRLCRKHRNEYQRTQNWAGRIYSSEKGRLWESKGGQSRPLTDGMRSLDAVQQFFDARCYYWRVLRKAIEKPLSDGSLIFMSRDGIELARLWIEVLDSETEAVLS